MQGQLGNLAGNIGPPAFAPAAYAEAMTQKKPVIVRQDADSVTIRHCEPVFKVTGSTAFVTYSRYVNPGDASIFPWLSITARGWEKYTFHNLAFVAKSRCPSSTSGSQILAMDYDAVDDVPVTSSILATYAGAVEDVPWKDAITMIDCSKLQPNLYIRRGALPVGTDRKTYDCGRFHVGVEDGAAILWSRVWVCYEVTLSVPQVAPEGATDVGTIVSTAGRAAANPLGTAQTKAGFCESSTVAGQHVTIPMEIGVRYYLSAQCTGTGISVFGFGSIVGATVTNQITSAINGTGTQAAADAVLTATNDILDFDLSTGASTVTTSHLVMTILPLNSGF